MGPLADTRELEIIRIRQNLARARLFLLDPIGEAAPLGVGDRFFLVAERPAAPGFSCRLSLSSPSAAQSGGLPQARIREPKLGSRGAGLGGGFGWR